MSILDILTHHGHNVIPKIAADGHVRFVPNQVHASVGASASAGGLAVKPHTFHGGVEPAVTQANVWWDEPGALDRDRATVAAAFPGFIEIEDPDGPPTWLGTINTGAGRFTVEIRHRLDRGLPTVIPVSPRARMAPNGRGMIQSPHLYDSGNLCVAAQEDWDPSTDTIATVIGWAAHWHAAYVVWRATRRWPSEGYRPDVA